MASWSLIKRTFSEYLADEPFQLAAALSYYTVLSLAPLLVLVAGIAGLVYGQDAAEGKLVEQIQAYTGHEVAEGLQTIRANAHQEQRGVMSTIIGGAALLVGATTVFGQLQTSLNKIWDVRAAPNAGTVSSMVRTRLIALGIILAVGFLLLVSLVISTSVSALTTYANERVPGASVLWRVLELAVSVGVITLLIALIFKYLPDVKIAWRDVWVGAFVTAVLFTLGKYGISVYLAQASVASAYGAAGSVVVLLVWVYYSALILFFGAEVTQVYTLARGKQIEPDTHAVAEPR